MFLLVYGGLVSLRRGFWMYRNNIGHESDHLDLAIAECKIKARTTGAVLMATSCVWAFAAVWARPTYEKSSDGTTHVANAGYELKAAPMKICSSIPFDLMKSNPQALENQFRKAIVRANADRHSELELNGEPALYIASSVNVSPVGKGTYLLEADVRTERSLGKVYFTIEGHENEITFRPWLVSGVVSPNEDPNSVRFPRVNEGSSSTTPKPLPFPNRNGESDQGKPSPSSLEH